MFSDDKKAKPKNKITKNLTPYVIGFGLIVGLVIFFKIIKANDKTK